MNKTKLIKALDKIIEKCGGPGGTPGPCPVSSGHDSHSAHKLSSSAMDASVEAFAGSGRGKSYIQHASDASRSARGATKAKDRDAAYSHHERAIKSHEKQIAVHKGFAGPGHRTAESNRMQAISAHRSILNGD